MNRFQTHFLADESGAVTVDWVVLTAALVGLGLATMGVVSSGVENVSGDIDTQLGQDHIIRTSFNIVPSAVGTRMQWGQSSIPSCSATPEGEVTCDPTVTTMWQEYWMSDGSLWTRQTETIDSNPPVVTWEDGDGNAVLASDYPVVEGELPFSMTAGPID